MAGKSAIQWHRCFRIRSTTTLSANPLFSFARPSRHFSHGLPRRTDGVFTALTETRVRTPWIEALRKQQEQGIDPTKPSNKEETPAKRNMEPKRMSDSAHSVILPLGQDPFLGDQYLNSSGHIRFGSILMDLDALSGVVAYKHTGPDVSTVTAACDRIILKNALTEICDLEYSGRVTYATGRSSMEVTLQVSKAPKPGKKVKDEDIILTCQFTMVSLDPGTKKPVNIPAILPETPEEQNLFDQGVKNSALRKERKSQSLLQHTPNDQESDLIHSLWQKQLQWHDPNDSLRKPDNVLFMDATRLTTAAIMQPQYRNRHNFMIFGGFLLKQTFELAFTAAASFAHDRPSFVSLDPSTFQNPVPVGSVLYMTATIVFCDSADQEDKELSYVQVRVDSKVRNVEHGDTKPTGQFNYTFSVPKNIEVMPRSYSEFMMYLDARRRAKTVQQTVPVRGEAEESLVE